MALEFWGDSRLVVNDVGGWQLREWPSGVVVRDGPGVAAPQPGGHSLAVCADGKLTVDGESIEPPASPVHLVSWYDDAHLVIACGEGADLYLPQRWGAVAALPVPEQGSTAQVYGSHSENAQEIWLLPLSGTPRRLRILPPTGQAFSVGPLGDGRVGVTEYVWPRFGAEESWRVLAVSLDGRCEDLLPDIDGYVDNPLPSPDGTSVALRTCEGPGWWFEPGIIRGGRLHRPFSAQMHMGRGFTWSTDGRLIVQAHEGLRIGALIAGTDRPLIPPTGTVHAVALRAAGDGVASYNALGNTPTLHSVTRDGLQPFDPVLHAASSRLEIVTWSSDGFALEGILALPPDLPGPLPLVVWVRGGPSVFQSEHAAELDEWTSRGFAALAVNYRASGMAGKQPAIDDLTSAHEPHLEGSVRDILAAVAAVDSRPEIDAHHVYVIGHSYGGFLVNRLVTRSHRMRAAVSWEAPADLVLLDRQAGGNPGHRKWFGGNPSTTDRFAAGSPINDAASVKTPLLLMAGENASLLQMVAWYTTLRDADVTTELVVYRDEGHQMNRPANQKDLYDRAAAWFRRFR